MLLVPLVVSFLFVLPARAFAPNLPAISATKASSQSVAFSTTLAVATKPAPVASNSRVSEELLQLFNAQVTKELAASQLYLSASIWCDAQDLVGMASYMRRESLEERNHAIAFIDFANKRNIPIKLESIEAPSADWKDVEDIWQDVLSSEQANTESLLALGDVAATCRDHSLSTFLQPYHMEQVNSEDSLHVILSKVTEENRTPGLIRQLDHELGEEAGSHQV